MTDTRDREPAWRSTLDRLVATGALDAAAARTVAAALEPVLGDSEPRVDHRGRRGVGRLLGELAGYLGAALLLAGTAVLVAASWEEWSTLSRSLVLAAVAVATLAGSLLAGRAARSRGPARWPDRAGQPSVGAAVRAAREAGAASRTELPGYRLRLSGALGAGAAFAGSSAVLVALEPRELSTDVLLMNLTGWLVALVAYAGCRSALSHVALVGFGAVAVGEVMNQLDASAAGFVAALAGYGVLWAALARLRVLREADLAVVAGGLVVLGGLRVGFVAEGTAAPALAYALAALLAAAAVAAYPRWRRWPLLAFAVLAATLAASELAADVFGSGTRAAAAVLLAAGGVLTLGSVLAIRRHRVVARDGPDEPVPSGTGRRSDAGAEPVSEPGRGSG